MTASASGGSTCSASGQDTCPLERQLVGRYVTARKFEADYSVKADVLGTGISGEVRMAVCRETGRRFAVKSFYRSKLSEQGWLAAQVEVRIHSTVEHPNIVSLERVYLDDDALHLVMEYLDGGEVFSRLASHGNFPEGQAAAVALQVLQALAYLHAHHVVHCDLKAENLVYDKKGSTHVKLIDFGFAQDWDGQGCLSRRRGTLHYMAPEVLARSYTEKADIWSVGVLLYTLLLGEHLYSGDGRVLLSRVAAGRPNFAASFTALSEGARSMISSLLVCDPACRPSAQWALQHPWLRHHAAHDARERLPLQTLRGFAVNRSSSSCRHEEQAALRHQFHGDGVITLDDLKQAVQEDAAASRDTNSAREECIPNAALEVEKLFGGLDTNGAGEVPWSELLAATGWKHAELHADAASAVLTAYGNNCGCWPQCSNAHSGLHGSDAHGAGCGGREEFGPQSSGAENSSPNRNSVSINSPSTTVATAKKRKPAGVRRGAGLGAGRADPRGGAAQYRGSASDGARQLTAHHNAQVLMELMTLLPSSLPFF